MIRVIEYVNLLKSKRSKAYSTSITAFNVYGTPGRMPPLVQFTPSRPTESSLRMSRHKKFVRPIAPRGLKNDPMLSASAPQARPTRAEASAPPPLHTLFAGPDQDRVAEGVAAKQQDCQGRQGELRGGPGRGSNLK